MSRASCLEGLGRTCSFVFTGRERLAQGLRVLYWAVARLYALVVLHGPAMIFECRILPDLAFRLDSEQPYLKHLLLASPLLTAVRTPSLTWTARNFRTTCSPVGNMSEAWFVALYNCLTLSNLSTVGKNVDRRVTMHRAIRVGLGSSSLILPTVQRWRTLWATPDRHLCKQSCRYAKLIPRIQPSQLSYFIFLAKVFCQKCSQPRMRSSQCTVHEQAIQYNLCITMNVHLVDTSLLQLTAGAAGFGALYWSLYGKPDNDKGRLQQGLGSNKQQDKQAEQWAELDRERQETSGKVWGLPTSEPGTKEKG